ncbi:hypothetical protein SB759_26725 [Pseudomonas sp. SIMBA_059]
MNYLEEEVDEAFKTLKIDSKKLEETELTDLIKSLTKKFFKSQSNVLDAINLNEKKTEHNPNFWREIENRIHKKNLILLVFDSSYRAWKVSSAQDIASILGETTGYPFWITDNQLTFLVHMDDHDCVIWA